MIFISILFIYADTLNQAQGALQSANWNLSEAVGLYYAAGDEPQEQGQDDDVDYDEPASTGQSAFAEPTPAQPAAPASSSSPRPNRNPPGQRPKQMTMDELRKRNEERDDDSEDENKPGQDMFAGGEKSGLAVQNPGQSRPPDHFKNIMNQARQNRDRPDATGEPENQQPRSSNFTGRAQTLGGDEAESEVIEDPLAPPPGSGRGQTLERVSRTLHLWADGISIDDGPLFRFDDPANQAIMAEINRGRAPLQLLDVQPHQEVDLNLEPHKDENYVQPKKIYRPFGGSGQRLGSPTPSAPSAVTAPSQPAASTSSAAQAGGQVNVDDSQPTVQLRINLGDGTRLQSRFNTTHTIGDVYAFVDRARPESTQRPYALMTTFPSKELDDRTVVLGDMSEFKRGGVVVQKWK